MTTGIPNTPTRKSVIFRSIALGLPLMMLMAWASQQAAREPAHEDEERRLWHHRNLGKAFYENPATHELAVEEFKAALGLRSQSAVERTNYGLSLLRAGRVDEGIRQLEQAQEADPSIPHTWFNLGIALKRQGRFEAALRQLEGFVERVPSDAAAHYNLGALHRFRKDNAKALEHFQKAARIAPHMAAPHFQLSQLHRVFGDADQARQEQDIFRQIKRVQAEQPVAENPEWSPYAEIYDVPQPDWRDSENPPAIRFEERTLAPDFRPLGLALLQQDGAKPPRILAWNESRLRIFTAPGDERLKTGLESVGGILEAFSGDFNDDGRSDLAILTTKDVQLWSAEESGRFARVPLALGKAPANKGIWLDIDHDSDLDLLLLSDSVVFLRNEGRSGFSNQSETLPSLPAQPLDVVAIDLIKDTNQVDLVVTFADQPALLLRDRLRGRFEPASLPQLGAGAASLIAGDVDNDGWTDLLGIENDHLVLLLNRHGDLQRQAPISNASGQIVLGDFANRGAKDLLAGPWIHSHQDHVTFGRHQRWSSSGHLGPMVVADFDEDGRLDLASGDEKGLTLFRNVTPQAGRWMRVSLEGVRSPHSGALAEVEIKAGRTYQKQIYRGFPLHFGLGSDQQAEVVRVTWPNGLIQNEIRVPSNQTHHYREKRRLSGSCPTVFVWNGREFVFLGDVLGSAPLGAPLAEEGSQAIDHDEYIELPASMAVSRDGHFEIRVTEELREVAYIDQIELVAIDHQAGLTILNNDRFTTPPIDDLRLYGVSEKLAPVSAFDSDGHDVREALLRRDRRYPDAFRRDLRGMAQEHFLELDFGSAAVADQALLVLNGWIDWPEGSAFVQAEQEGGGGLQRPSIQAQDAQGNWTTIVKDMGIPAGKPRTIVVDLSGRFPSKSRRIRILTNLCLYWDEIYLSPDAERPSVRLTRLRPSQAQLRFHGFSLPILDPARKQPELFDYSQRIPLAPWNPTAGLYTRYGEVTELMGRTDDRLVVMGSGDELRLRFDVAELPVLEAGWQRSYLIYFDGWVKDGDLNTASHDSVEPLPFHGMSRYPYSERESLLREASYWADRARYLTRPGLRLLRPLER